MRMPGIVTVAVVLFTFGPRVTAGDVKSKIEAAFRRSAEIDARRITVETRDGKVKLHGNVHSWTEWEKAQQAAWTAPGLMAVENGLMVVP